MSEKLVIVVGDKTSHSGTVISGDNSFEINEKIVARVGDKVSCPEHGETEIIEGFPLTLLDEKYIAYDGCKTSCGATLIAGGQKILFVELVQEKTSPQPPPSTRAINTNLKETCLPINLHTYPNEPIDEFDYFVATVWGEAANQSKVGWQAVGSVIINRVGSPFWKDNNNNVTVRTVIDHTGFDAAKGFNEQFNKVTQYTFYNNSTALNAYEKKKYQEMRETLTPIYYEKKVITNANHYYSPRLQSDLNQKETSDGTPVIHKKAPIWAKKYKQVEIENLSPHDDLVFVYRDK